MSGKTKRILYHIISSLFVIAAFVGLIFMFYAANGESFIDFSRSMVVVSLCFFAIFVVFPLPLLVHECGHLLFGFLGGMRFYSFFVHWFGFYRTGRRLRFSGKRFTSGETQMFPKNGEHVRGRALFFSVGGIILNLIYAAVFLALFFTAPRSPALLFFEYFAPFSLAEGFIALYPVELLTGKTDGAVALGILKNSPEEEVMLRVFQAQGILNQGNFSDFPKDLLFDVPVIREDSRAFLALIQLRYQFLIWQEKTDEAKKELQRAQSLLEYFPEESGAEMLYDYVYFRVIFLHENADAIRFPCPKEKTVGYYRAVAAVTDGEARQNAVKRAEELINRFPMRGMRAYEKKLLGILIAGEKKALR